MSDIDETLKERGARYGDFADQSIITQALKAVMTAHMGMKLYAPDQHEALEMIAVKIARIINGDPNYADNWHDIAGYAQLVANRLSKP